MSGQLTGRIESCVELLAEDRQQPCIDVESLENGVTGWIKIVAGDRGSPGSATEIICDRHAADCLIARVFELLVGLMVVASHSLNFLEESPLPQDRNPQLTVIPDQDFSFHRVGRREVVRLYDDFAETIRSESLAGADSNVMHGSGNMN